MVRPASLVAGVAPLAALASPAAAQFNGGLTATVWGEIDTDFQTQDLASLDTSVVDGLASGQLLPTGLQPGVPTGSFEFSIASVDNITREVSFSFLFDDGVVPDGATFMGEPFLTTFFSFRTDADLLLADDDAVLEVLSTELAFSTVDTGFEPPFSFDSTVRRAFDGVLEFGVGRSQTVGGSPTPADELGINGLSGSFTYRVVPAPGAAALIGLATLGVCGRRRKVVMA